MKKRLWNELPLNDKLQRQPAPWPRANLQVIGRDQANQTQAILAAFSGGVGVSHGLRLPSVVAFSPLGPPRRLSSGSPRWQHSASVSSQWRCPTLWISATCARLWSARRKWVMPKLQPSTTWLCLEIRICRINIYFLLLVIGSSEDGKGR